MKAEGAYAEENVFRFSTKYFDVESGFYYYGFRYYLVELGRWGSRDPIGEKEALNLLLFISNNSLNKIDPIGLFEGIQASDFYLADDSFYLPIKEWDEYGPVYENFNNYVPNPPQFKIDISLYDFIKGAIGRDEAWPLATIPVPNLGGSIHIDGFISAKYFECLNNGIREEWLAVVGGVEIYFIWGYAGKKGTPKYKQRDANKRPGGPGTPKYKHLKPEKREHKGFRGRNWHNDHELIETKLCGCPEKMINMGLYAFVRGSFGVGCGTQFNVQQNYDINLETKTLSVGAFQLQGIVAKGIIGASLEVGGGGQISGSAPVREFR